jgi:hypothetical protein
MALAGLCGVAGVFAGEVSTAGGARLDITSRTTFGVDLGSPYRYGLKNELTRFDFVYSLAGYQQLTNLVKAPDPVGFVNITLFNFDIQMRKVLGYNADGAVDGNRYQTGIFQAGIAWGKWIFQLNAGANEPFWSPWNKGLEYVNDKVKFSWAYLDSMVDVKRLAKVAAMKPQDPAADQFKQDGAGDTDSLGASFSGPAVFLNSPSVYLNTTGSAVAAMFTDEAFGLNFKALTEYGYDDPLVTATNANGIAAGVDAVVMPAAAPGLKILASAAAAKNWGVDALADPLLAGFKVGRNTPLNDAISLEPYVGLDAELDFPASGAPDRLKFEAAAGVTMHWPGRGGWYTDYILNKDGRVFPGMSLAYKAFGDTANLGALKHNLKFTLFEERGDDGVFYGLGAEAVVDFTDLASANRTLMSTVYLDYTLPGFAGTAGSLVPWIVVCWDNIPVAAGRDDDLKLDLGAKLVDAIANTTLGLTWNSGNLLTEGAAPGLGYLKATAEVRF